MKKWLSVLNSDQINKYNYQFAVSALENGMRQKCITGVPMHVSHDMHRLAGWMIPFGLYFEPNLVRSVGKTIIPETDEEQAQISEARMQYIYSMTKEDIDKHGDSFMQYINTFLSGEHKYLSAAALSIFDTNILDRVFPNFKSKVDKDGLVPVLTLLDDFVYKAQGVFFHKTLPLCIYCHQFFRKSFSRHNNFNHYFLDELIGLKEKPDITIKIALDWDMIGYSPSYLDSHELEFWFGPKYNDDITSIQPGLTKHVSDEFERMYNGISSTEFFWKINENLHEFELEELKEDENPALNDTYSCRYIHSIYDNTLKSFVHFDGAVRSYNSELYFERIDKKMTEFGRRSQYEKLFRVDGKINLGIWKSLSTNYLQGNSLIYEYFGLDKPKANYVHNKMPKSVKSELVPYSINSGEGVRIMISYHPKNVHFTEHRVVSICDNITNNDKEQKYLEYDVIEVKKALNRLGKDLIIPNDVYLGCVEDLYWNIPCIFHGAPNPQEDLDITVRALSNIIVALNSRLKNEVISFTLSWNMNDKEVRFSILGHVFDLMSWLTRFSTIPTKLEDLTIWMEQQKKYLNSLNINKSDLPSLDELSQFDGILYIKRRFLGDEVGLQIRTSNKGVEYAIEIPEHKSDVLSALENGEIQPTISVIVKKILCSKTNSNYWDSPYSKILDDDVHVIMENVELVGAIWTDKPSQNLKNFKS